MASSKATDITINTQYLQIGGRAWGDKNNPPILALHGWLDNAASFDHLAPLIENYYLVAIDLPGHGLSEHFPSGASYHFIDYVGVVKGVLDELGWSKLTLLGHSMGAGVCSLFAGTFPEMIEKVVLVEGLGPLSGEEDSSPERLARSINEMAGLDEKMNTSYNDFERAVKVRQAVGSMSEESVMTLVKRGLEKKGDEYSWRRDLRLTVGSPIYMTEGQVLSFLRGIDAPVLLVVGESGHKFLKSQMQHRAEAVANLKVEHMPGHHHLHLDRADDVAAAINRFLG